MSSRGKTYYGDAGAKDRCVCGHPLREHLQRITGGHGPCINHPIQCPCKRFSERTSSAQEIEFWRKAYRAKADEFYRMESAWRREVENLRNPL